VVLDNGVSQQALPLVANQKDARDVLREHVSDDGLSHYLKEPVENRTSVFALPYYVASRTLLWAGHVARMPKSRLPKRLHAFAGAEASASLAARK
jgi:hypothetical protein